MVRNGQPDQMNHNTAGKSPELWPTPVANDDNKTPEAHLAMKQRMGGNRTAITSLNVKVKAKSSNWATPEGIAKERARRKNGHDLPTKANEKLNADWVESLMNVPLGWTQLPLSWVTESTDSGCSAMELFRQQHPRLLQRSTKN